MASRITNPFPFMAVNVALVASRYQWPHLERLNSALFRHASSECASFKFNQTHLPHVTLAQLYCHPSDITKLGAAINQTVTENNLSIPISLKVAKIDYATTFAGEMCPYYTLECPQAVRAFHSSLVNSIRNMSEKPNSPEARINAFFRDVNKSGDNNNLEDINEQSQEYVLNFIEKSSHENWKPHLMLGASTSKGVESLKELVESSEHELSEIEFDTLGIFRLGNFCTCREQLWQLRNHSSMSI